MMRFIVSILAGFLGAGVGMLLGFGIGSVLAEVLDVSCFEGACGYFVALIVLIGGAIGLVAGILIALTAGRRRAVRSLGKGVEAAGAPARPAGAGTTTFGRLVGAIVVVAGLVAGGTWLYAWMMDDSLGGANQATPQLHYEIRFPPGTRIPETISGIDVQLDTEKNQAWGDMFDDWRRQDGDRPVVAGFFDLYYRANSRVLSVRLPDTERFIFRLKLPRAPGHMAEYTDWYPADAVDAGGADDQPREATGDEGVDIHYRVVYAGED